LRSCLLPPEQDLLKIARFTYDENAYTDLMAWSLRPATHPQSALRRQSEWLRSLGLSEADSVNLPAEPAPHVCTDDGRPDLVLYYPGAGFMVVLEAKTVTAEHATPGSGLPQSHTYPPAVLRRLGLDPSTIVQIVFLSPDGREAANPSAIKSTYLQFAAALATVVCELDDDLLRLVFRQLITHLATCAVPWTFDTRQILDRLTPLLDGSLAANAESLILENLDGINHLLRLLPQRRPDG
jgi:hypothetical protein